jgi:hypothetical protein
METKANTKPTVLDLLRFDPTLFYQGEYKEIDSQDTPAIQIVDYEIRLPELEMEIFDTLRFRVLFDKNNITGDTHVNATYKSKKKMTSWEETASVVQLLHNNYGKDDTGNTAWTDSDKLACEDGSFMRVWPSPMGDSFLSVYYKETGGLEMNILFLNNLLRHMGRKILF